MAFIPAKCTQCGANIEVDDSRDAGICKFCGTAFVTEKAINHYNIQNATINVSGFDINNLLIRARNFEKDGDSEKAIEYYNRILDIDANYIDAIQGIERLTKFYIGSTQVSRKEICEIETLLNQMEKIKAIKLVRDLTGLGLAEAKAFVDNFSSYNLNVPQQISVDVSQNQNDLKNNNGCYVATAVYGSYDCPQVWVLRRYRDNTLASTWYGRVFIRTYYTVSPTIVKWFGDTKWFKHLWKNKLDKLVFNLQISGVEDTPYQDTEWR